jgi:hypothetical protein
MPKREHRIFRSSSSCVSSHRVCPTHSNAHTFTPPRASTTNHQVSFTTPATPAFVGAALNATGAQSTTLALVSSASQTLPTLQLSSYAGTSLLRFTSQHPLPVGVQWVLIFVTFSSPRIS